MTDRYDISLNVEGQFQPGSNGLVLANKLAIIDKEEMANTELVLLVELYEVVFSMFGADQAVTVADIFEWHRKWLGNVYDWAGQERSVNMGKGGFHFTVASQIPYGLREFEKNYLMVLTPCHLMNEDALVDAIARVHVEFILVHPFRDGNGRISRLLADVMALQGNKPALDYSSWDTNKGLYFNSIQAGLAGDYAPMKTLVKQALLDAEQRLNA